jgi:hypothetical protein
MLGIIYEIEKINKKPNFVDAKVIKIYYNLTAPIELVDWS